MSVTPAGLFRRIGKEVTRARLRLKAPGARTLTDLANIYGSDKGDLWFAGHRYTEVYEQLFAGLRRRPLTLLEIGLRHHPFYRFRSTTSPSLRMWLDYFPQALVCGFDINEFSSMGSSRVRIFRGDQGNPADLMKMLASVGALDIVIDDGSHASYHQLVTLHALLPAVKPGGLYIIEDLCWQPEELEQSLPKTDTMVNLLRSQPFLHSVGLDSSNVRFFLNDALAVITMQDRERFYGVLQDFLQQNRLSWTFSRKTRSKRGRR